MLAGERGWNQFQFKCWLSGDIMGYTYRTLYFNDDFQISNYNNLKVKFRLLH